MVCGQKYREVSALLAKALSSFLSGHLQVKFKETNANRL